MDLSALAERPVWRVGLVGALVLVCSLAGISFASERARDLEPRRAAICMSPGVAKRLTVQLDGVSQRPRRFCGGRGRIHRGVSTHVAVYAPPPVAPAARQAEPAAPATLAEAAVATPPAEPPTVNDTIPPQTLIAAGPSGTTASTTANFALGSSEVGSTFECRLDTGGWAPCDPTVSYSNLDPGSHRLLARAVDTAGNIDASPATRSWTVQVVTPPPGPDTTPPQTSISSGPPATTASTSASFSLSSSEADSTFECQLDDAGWLPCSPSPSYTGLGLGAHQFAARATDAAGNVDTSPATRSWTVQEPPPPPPPPPPPADCTTVETSTSAAASAVSAAAAGSVVCLADGSYGEVSLSTSKPDEVTLQAEHPGQATITGASLDGEHLTLARFDITGEVTVQPGSVGMTIEYNRITGGYMGINAGPTTSTSISDTTIRGNQLVGPFGEDALRLNRYHDSADSDPFGILIEGNEITGVRENGNHSDCLQSVWGGDALYFRNNYLHDNRCQGFFVKDQPEAVAGMVVENNLFVRNNEPCGPPLTSCGQPSYFQVFGPYQDLIMRRNTIWQGDVIAVFQDGSGPGTVIEANVVDRFWTSTDLSAAVYRDNTRCQREASGGSWPSQAPGEIVDCSPAFADPVTDDLRLPGSNRGVDWAPSEVHYGP